MYVYICRFRTLYLMLDFDILLKNVIFFKFMLHLFTESRDTSKLK